MEAPVVVVGMGQLGRILSEGVLRTGVPVVPVLRHQSIRDNIDRHPDARCILLSVGEDDLHAALQQVPESALDRVVLLQNELRPDQWRSRYAPGKDPGVLVVWFERKGDRPPTVLLPSLFFPGFAGTGTSTLPSCLKALDVDCQSLSSTDELCRELVIKNLYILGLNLVGLKTGGTAGQLLNEHRRTFDVVLDELLMIEDALFAQAGFVGMAQQRDRLREGLERAILADVAHGARGRSAPRRLERTLAHAHSLGLHVPHLDSLKKHV